MIFGAKCLLSRAQLVGCWAEVGYCFVCRDSRWLCSLTKLQKAEYLRCTHAKVQRVGIWGHNPPSAMTSGKRGIKPVFAVLAYVFDSEESRPDKTGGGINSGPETVLSMRAETKAEIIEAKKNQGSKMAKGNSCKQPGWVLIQTVLRSYH